MPDLPRRRLGAWRAHVASQARRLRFADVLVGAATLAGLFLLIHRFAWNGSTWDEMIDYRIAQDLARNGTLLSNTVDPTQGRLPHLIGAVFLAVLGAGVWVFKLPFALAGLAGGALLYLFVAPRYGRRTALYCLAYYLTNPWILASSRSAATAGDILVVVTTFGFFWAAVRCVEDGRSPAGERRRGTVVLALLAGISVGAKLTLLVLLPLGLLLVAATRRSLAHVAAFTLIAAVFAAATHPILVTDTPLLVGATRRAIGSGLATSVETLGPTVSIDERANDGSRRFAEVDLVSHEPTPKLRYLAALLVGKLTLPFLLVVAAGVAYGTRRDWRRRRLDPAFWGAAAAVVATCGFVWKFKQNPNYFLPLVLPSITLAAIPLARLLGSPRHWLRLTGSLGWLALLLYQIWIGAALAPDYLQAGRRLGPSVQGTMDGPAVNHCQGTPLLIDRLNTLRQHERFERVYVFETCLSVIAHDSRLGPVRPNGYVFSRYPPRKHPSGAHLFVVHEVIRYFKSLTAKQVRRMDRLGRAMRGCETVAGDGSLPRYTIYRCAHR